MLTVNQTAALKRVTKKLSAMRKALPKPEREMLDYLIVGATTEVKGHAASIQGQASDHGQASVSLAKKTSKRSLNASAEVQGHVAYDTRIGAKKDQGMLKDNGAVHEGGAMHDQSAAAEVMGHMATTTGAATTAGAATTSGAAQTMGAAQTFGAAQDARASVVFNATTSGYTVVDK